MENDPLLTPSRGRHSALMCRNDPTNLHPFTFNVDVSARSRGTTSRSRGSTVEVVCRRRRAPSMGCAGDDLAQGSDRVQEEDEEEGEDRASSSSYSTATTGPQAPIPQYLLPQEHVPLPILFHAYKSEEQLEKLLQRTSYNVVFCHRPQKQQISRVSSFVGRLMMFTAVLLLSALSPYLLLGVAASVVAAPTIPSPKSSHHGSASAAVATKMSMPATTYSETTRTSPGNEAMASALPPKTRHYKRQRTAPAEKQPRQQQQFRRQTSTDQQQDGAEQCLVFACCDEDCCGARSSFNERLGKCVHNSASAGFDGNFSDQHELGCARRQCCEDACCGPETIYIDNECVGLGGLAPPAPPATAAPTVAPTKTPFPTQTDAPPILFQADISVSFLSEGCVVRKYTLGVSEDSFLANLASINGECFDLGFLSICDEITTPTATRMFFLDIAPQDIPPGRALELSSSFVTPVVEPIDPLAVDLSCSVIFEVVFTPLCGDIVLESRNTNCEATHEKKTGADKGQILCTYAVGCDQSGRCGTSPRGDWDLKEGSGGLNGSCPRFLAQRDDLDVSVDDLFGGGGFFGFGNPP